jgi:hypothetical protein
MAIEAGPARLAGYIHILAVATHVVLDEERGGDGVKLTRFISHPIVQGSTRARKSISQSD